MKLARGLVIIMAITVLVLACPLAATSKPAWEQEWESTLAKAKEEGKVSVYTIWGSRVTAPLSQRFKQRYGIELEFTTVGRVLTLTDERATIQQGTSIPYAPPAVIGAGSGQGWLFVEATLRLEVTPHVAADNSIVLEVKASNNEPTSIPGSNAPVLVFYITMGIALGLLHIHLRVDEVGLVILDLGKIKFLYSIKVQTPLVILKAIKGSVLPCYDVFPSCTSKAVINGLVHLHLVVFSSRAHITFTILVLHLLLPRHLAILHAVKARRALKRD